jgi:hypothetical protein
MTRLARFSLIVGLALASLLGPAQEPSARQASIEFLDVGQGDAILIRSPEGKTALVDAGPHRSWSRTFSGLGEMEVPDRRSGKPPGAGTAGGARARQGSLGGAGPVRPSPRNRPDRSEPSNPAESGSPASPGPSYWLAIGSWLLDGGRGPPDRRHTRRPQ